MMASCSSGFFSLCLRESIFPKRLLFHLNHAQIFSNSSSPSCSYSSSTLKPTQEQKPPNVINILEQRGLLDSLTSDKLRSDCTSKPLRVYCGFDPTAPSLHLGNLLGIVVLSWFLRCRHAAVALVGGATGRVGDPSGKTLERPELDPDTLEANISAIEHNLRTILVRNNNNDDSSFDDDGMFVVMNNYDWWKDVKLLDFLTQVGRFARVGAMMSKDSVRRRLDKGMSFTEFTYQLLQGYDFVHLFTNKGVNVQIGGSDQWGNITAGTDLLETKSAARRLLKQGGLYLNNIRVDDEAKRIENEDVIQGQVLLLSAGKKNRIVVRVS